MSFPERTISISRTDEIEAACRRDHVNLVTRALRLAHFDASLKGSSAAEQFSARHRMPTGNGAFKGRIDGL